MQTPEPTAAAGQPANPGNAAHTCLQRALAHLTAARNHARGWQLDALHRAVADELAHPAIGGDGPLTDALRRQLECAADEGAQPTTTAGAGLTPQQWHALANCHREGGRGWLAAGAALLAVAAAVFSAWPWGFAS